MSKHVGTDYNERCSLTIRLILLGVTYMYTNMASLIMYSGLIEWAARINLYTVQNPFRVAIHTEAVV